MPGLFQLLLGLADRCDFGSGIDHARDHVVIHVPRLARQDLGESDPFILRLMREHRPFDHVADGVDAGHAGRVMRIDDDAPAIVGFHARFGEAKTLRVRHAADGDEHDIAFEGLRLAALRRLQRELQALALGVDASDLDAELEGEALLGEHALKLLRHLAVKARRHAIQHLDHGDLEPSRDQTEPSSSPI